MTSNRPYKRRTYLIDKQSQLKFTFYTVIAFLIASLFFILVLYMPVYLSTVSATDNVQLVLRQIDVHFVETSVLPAAFAFILVVIFFTIFHTHKVFGPIFRFQQSMKKIQNGEVNFQIHLRKWDYLKGVEYSFNDLIMSLREKLKNIHDNSRSLNKGIKELKEKIDKGEISQDELSQELDKINSYSQDIDRSICEFKIK